MRGGEIINRHLKTLLGMLVLLISSCKSASQSLSHSDFSSSSSQISSSESSEESSSQPEFFASDIGVQKSVSKINSFPDIPSNYRYYDYKSAAKELDRVMFGFANDSTVKIPSYISSDPSSWNPIGYWLDQPRQPPVYNPLETGYLKRTFGLPTYVGDNRVVSSGSEAMTTISSVLGASYAGIDKQNQQFGETTYDFVEMTFASYDTGSNLVHNYGVQGQSFWYDLFPQIIFARLYELYPDTPFMEEIVLNGADEWLEALPYFVIDEQPNYEFVGYNVVLESPTITGGHIEPPNGGLAALFYSAYKITGDEKYLDGAKEVLDYLQTYQKNPNYEALTDYAPYIAAILNAFHGTAYDVGKFIDFLFDGDSAFRPGWAVMNGFFGDYPVHGLVGQADDYAFAMNSLHLATTLAPMVKYDARYGDAIGKYILNLVSNARYFFPQTHALSHQSMNSYLTFDTNGTLIYEGFRRSWNSVTGYAMGDATTMFGQPSDLSLYSSAFIGGLGAIVAPTNINGILRIDLNATDSFGPSAIPGYLLYNPYDRPYVVNYDGPAQPYDLFDAGSQTILARNVTGSVHLRIPAKQSLVVRQLPALSVPQLSTYQVFVGDELIARKQASVNLTNIVTRQELTSASNINIEMNAPLNDEIVNMKVYFGSILAYDGVPLETYRYNKALLPNTDYTMRIEILTSQGHSDYVTKRVVCR